VKTLEKLAEVKEVTPVEMAEVTSRNFFALFDKVTMPQWAA
jgi:Tat protein secretion system quality control protein TatD with DNase activity